MTRFQRFGWVSFACFVLFSSSCMDSVEPLCKPEEAKADKDLIGTWRAKLADGAYNYYHIALAGGNLPAGVMRFVTVEIDKNQKLSRPGEMLGFSSTVREQQFLNVAMIDDKDLGTFEDKGWNPKLPKGYVIVRYQISGDELTVWIMDALPKRRLIEAEKLKGTIEKNGAVFFTDTPENIAKVLAGPESDGLFTKTPTVFTRVKED